MTYNNVDIREQYALASLARQKLFLSGKQTYNSVTNKRKDIQLRVVIGHANLLDSVMDSIEFHNQNSRYNDNCVIVRGKAESENNGNPVQFKTVPVIATQDAIDYESESDSDSDSGLESDSFSDDSEDSDLEYDENIDDFFSDEDESSYIFDHQDNSDFTLSSSSSNSQDNNLSEVYMSFYMKPQKFQLPVFKKINV